MQKKLFLSITFKRFKSGLNLNCYIFQKLKYLVLYYFLNRLNNNSNIFMMLNI